MFPDRGPGLGMKEGSAIIVGAGPAGLTAAIEPQCRSKISSG